MSSTEKRLLFLAHRIPYPPNKGDKIRTFNQVKHLSRYFEIDLVTLADQVQDLKYQNNLEAYCRSVHVSFLNPLMAKLQGFMRLAGGGAVSQAYYSTPGFQKRVKHLLSSNPYDAILCFSSSMAGPVLKHVKMLDSRSDSPRMVMDYCDVDSEKWRQYGEISNFPMNRVYNLESKRLRRFERVINQRFDASVFVSKKEADLFRERIPDAVRVYTVGNGVDVDFFSPKNGGEKDARGQRRLMFAGAMDYHANVEGVTWFCRTVLPRLERKLPDVCFDIVGSNPVPQVKALARDGRVRVTGFVEDIRPYYGEADLVVVPLRIARGLQNKVLEAMAMAKPVVASASAIEGIGAQPGIHLVPAEDPDTFAVQIERLLKDRDTAEALGASARKFVAGAFSWESAMASLVKLLDGPS